MALALILLPLVAALVAFAIPSNGCARGSCPSPRRPTSRLVAWALGQPPARRPRRLARRSTPRQARALVLERLLPPVRALRARLPAAAPERTTASSALSLLAFLAMLSLIVEAHHLGLMWVAMEATTLASAPLLYFNRTPQSLEATGSTCSSARSASRWRSSGRSSSPTRRSAGGASRRSCSRTSCADAPRLSRPWLESAFVLLFVGYGTKMGLAPMHTWKPDAYGEAPGLVGALLAGGLTNCAFLAILRFYRIVSAAGEGGVRATAHDRRRAPLDGRRRRRSWRGSATSSGCSRTRASSTWASSSSASGIGGAGVFGGLLHVVNNGLTKGVLFLSAAQHPPRVRQQEHRRGQRGAPPRPRRRRALSRGLLRDHRLAAVRAVPQRVHDPRTRRSREGTASSARSFSSCSPSSSSAWARRCWRSCRASRRSAAEATSVPGDAGSPSRPSSRSSACVLMLGLYLPRPLDALSSRRRRLRRGRDRDAPLVVAATAARSIATASRAWTSTGFRRTVVGRAGASMRASSALFGIAAPGDDAWISSQSSRTTRGRASRSRARASSPTRSTSMTPDCPQAHLFEREIAEQWRLVAEGHPWLKPVRFHALRARARRLGPRPTSSVGRDGLLPGRGRRGARGRRRPGPRRRHRARTLPLPVPRRGGLSPRDLARLPAPRRGARARRRAEQANHPLHGDPRGRHDDRPRDGVLPASVEALAGTPRARAGPGAARRRARARAARQPHRRPRRARERRRLSADRVVLRAPARRLPEPDRGHLRQPLRARPGAPRRRRLRRGRRRASRMLERLDAAARDVAGRGGAALGYARRCRRASRTPARCRPEDAEALGLVGVGGARVRPRARRAPRPSRRDLPLRAHPGLRLATRATSSPAPSCAGSRSSARSPSSASSSRACPRARHAVPRGRARRRTASVVSLVEGWRGEICHVALTDARGTLLPLQDRRPVVPQLARASRWRCAGSRSPTSRSATRASTSPTAATISEAQVRHAPRSSSHASSKATARCAYPATSRRSCPTASAALPRHRRRRSARTAAAPARRRARPTPSRADARRVRARPRAAASSAPTASTACPEGAISFTRGLPPRRPRTRGSRPA